MDKILENIVFTNPDEELLAIDGLGITPLDSLSNLQGLDDYLGKLDAAERVKNLLNQSGKLELPKPTLNIPSTNPLAVTELVKKGGEFHSIYSKNINTVKKHPLASEYKEDLALATLLLENLKDIKYTEIKSIKGDLRNVDPTKDLQKQVEHYDYVYGVKHINPAVEDALFTGVCKRAIDEKDSIKLSNVRESNSWTTNKFKELLLDNSDKIIGSGDIDLLAVFTSVITTGNDGGNYSYGSVYDPAPKFLAAYTNKGTRSDVDERNYLFTILSTLNPKWSHKGTTTSGASVYDRRSFSKASPDAKKIFSSDKTSIFKMLVQLAKDTGFDKKVKDKVKRKIKERG